MAKPVSDYIMYLVELLGCVGAVKVKSMFGGYGVYAQGVMFALIHQDILYLKVNADTVTDFTQKGLLPFSYQKQGKTHHIHYYQCPEEALEDEDVMRIWAVNAYQVALTAQSLKSVSLFDD